MRAFMVRTLLQAALIGSLVLMTSCSSSQSDSGEADPVDDSPADGQGTGAAISSDMHSDAGGAPVVSDPADNLYSGDDTATGHGDPGGNMEPASVGISVNRVLEPLPDPPLTPPSAADSEPVRSTGPVSTISEFFVVRDPVRNLEDNFGALTDADFEAGPLPAIVHVPEGFDTTGNAPPYFVDLNDIEVFAGEELNIRFRPLDADGGVPGQFASYIPPGARYPDNRDGTRSLIWRPLQPQIGIQEFTVTATDPVEAYYRTERTIRIRIKMPSDPSTIVNLPPGINEIRTHTVRVNDPVTLYVKVTDPNGTIPALEVGNPPPGSTIVPHHSEPGISIIRFIPRTIETLSLELLARDAVDDTLTTTRSVTVDVRDEADFVRTGLRLRQLADNHELLIGYAALQDFHQRPDGALYTDIAAEEFNFVTTENSLKWDLVNPQPGKYRWAQTDNLVQLARSRQQAVHGHTLVWHRQLPGWIMRSSRGDREIHMREFIDRVLTRYGTDIPVWDVVNEALEEDGSFRHSTWYEAMGADFIDIAFRQARQSAPAATLLYNDYDVSFAGPKSDGLLSLMTALKDAGTPVDGVGFQMHLDADFDRFDEVEATFQAMAALDLDIYITELDVSMQRGLTEVQQATVFEEVLSLCLAQPRCKAYQTWGFTDMYSWRREFMPLIFDERYQPKPAYRAIQRRLGEN